jgi:3-deoxy-manno-octulosonate cytidylyltransferase (CMP-KDO synthetase)
VVGDVMRVAAIIPARYSSTRFPGKALTPILGKPMIQWVYERTCQAEVLDEVLVATDDKRILKTVQGFGGKALLTSPHHQSGTERVMEAAAGLEAEVIVNVQGDEPLIQPAMIAQAVAPLMKGEEAPVVSLRYPISRQEELEDPNIVKVVTDQQDYALYFSRLPIPYNRTGGKAGEETDGTYWKHIGLYVYRGDFLQNWGRLKPSPLEQAEQLEQLRVLENGYRIKVLPSLYDSWGVDTPADIARVYRVLQQAGESNKSNQYQ